MGDSLSGFPGDPVGIRRQDYDLKLLLTDQTSAGDLSLALGLSSVKVCVGGGDQALGELELELGVGDMPQDREA